MTPAFKTLGTRLVIGAAWLYLLVWPMTGIGAEGLEFAKGRFQGTVGKNYCCHKRSTPLISLLALLGMTGVV